ncbi:uncharacterized protein LOC113350699 [Papaver somniferum]|uniref:uncharacterized protein LOC113350699 n=1 Tax=Papaver somniferum TaxID=3469 RepID=UPI000E6F5D65|nr:uncharacterized protein LOC113350699 [Papaver somniferum]
MDSCPKTTEIEKNKVNIAISSNENNYQKIPSKELPDDLFEESLNPWIFSLIGILNLQQLKFVDAAIILRRQWNLEGDCKLIPLGRGFFTIKLDNAIDRQYIEEGTCYYANVLVEVDFAKSIPKKIWIGTKYGGFFQDISIPDFPKFYSNCKILAHLVTECRVEKSRNQSTGEGHNHITSKTSNTSNHQQSPKNGNASIQQQGPKTPHIPFDICNNNEDVANCNNKEVVQVSTSNSVLNPLVEDSVVSNIITPPIQTTSVVVHLNSGRFNTLSQIENREEDEVSINEEIMADIEPHKLIQIADVTELKKSEFKSMVIHNASVNHKSNIWLFWSNSVVTPSVVSVTSQMITVEVGNVLVSGVHTHVKVVQRRFLWYEMRLISDLNKPWLIIGDFNVVLTMEEKVGGNSPSRRSMLDFNECINACELIQDPKVGLDFSWSNCQHGSKRILCNLDRTFFNLGWLQMYGYWGYKVGIRVVSHHSPLLGGCANVPKPKNVPLRFQKMWLEHPGFMKIVEDSWAEPIQGDPTYVFMQKLKRLKVILKEWNWKIFGNIQVKIQEAEVLVK